MHHWALGARKTRGLVCSRIEGREGHGAQRRTFGRPRGTSTYGSTRHRSEESEP
jgi:hypothetical protein